MTRTESEPSPPKLTQTYLGFDYGNRKIGIAVGQNLTQTARDLDTVSVKGSSPDWERITRHVNTWQPVALVVGVPLDSDGRETAMTKRAKKFGQTLSDRYNLPVHWVNEYLTSEAARLAIAQGTRSGKTSRKRDQVAARLILETFLGEQNNK
ncbi:MAG: Holliday junction resolvase RuvX [Arenicellales bacterium]|nr:Holliday junction resolvase RuvX [Arenicellales bacterium]